MAVRDKSTQRNLTSLKSLFNKKSRLVRGLRQGVWPLIFIALVSMCFLSLARLAWTIWHLDMVAEGTLGILFLQGIRIDFASVCGLYALPFLVLMCFSLNPFGKVPKFALVFIKIYVALGIAFLVMNEAATPSFIKEYGVRPNHIYVQYLMYPKEVFLTLWGGHKLELILSLLVTAIALFLGYKLADFCFRYYKQSSLLKTLQIFLIGICIIPLGIRSTLGHRPLNPSMVAFTDNALVNSLPVNSSYNVVYAFFHLDDAELDEDKVFKVVTGQEVIEEAYNFSIRNNVATVDKKCPINQIITPFDGVYTGQNGRDSVSLAKENLEYKEQAVPRTNKLYNVVIILEESLGDNFVASQGGFPMTPYLEKLREKGWWFENLYASGHRSIRGIEAVTASFPPSALQSIVKLQKPVEPYATIFNIFSEAGYDTSFIYGGESHFDNMRSYFLENGMSFVVEQKDYANPSFVASWGVSDEDLFNRANEHFKEKYANNEKFFSVIFSSSFHDPFEIPENKVSLDGFKTNEPERLLAAKYADYAMGTYLERASKEDYYKDTIFLVIADHESRVQGTGLFPLNDFTIPGVIIAPNVKPHVDYRQVSQLDMGMTLMSLAGLKGSVPNIGQDLTRKDIKERAMMQFNTLFGLLEHNKFISLSPHQQPFMYEVDEQEGLHRLDTIDEDMVKRATLMSNLGNELYRNNYMAMSCIQLDPKIKEQVMRSQSQSKEKAQTKETVKDQELN